MSEQENMDDLLRSKFSEMDFPFDEENWAKAEEMIIASRKKEKRRRWVIIFFFGILIGVLVMIPFALKNSPTEKTKTISENQKNTIVTDIKPQENNSAISTEVKPTGSDSNQKEENKSEKIKKENSSENPQAENAEKNRSSKESKKSPEIESKVNSGVITENMPSSSETKPLATKTQKEKKQKNELNTVISAEPKEDNSSEDTTPAKKENKKINKPVIAAETKELIKNNAAPVSEIKKPENTSKYETKKEVLPIVAKTDNTKKQTTPVIVASAEIKKQESNAVQEPKKETDTPAVIVAESKNNVTEQKTGVSVTGKETTSQQPSTTIKDSTTAITKNTKKDSVPVTTKPETKKDSIPKNTSSWIVSLDGGINGFYSGGSGISPIAGINITKLLSPKWEIGSGVYYTYIPTFSGASTFTTDATYDFGSTFTLTEIVTTKLHYVTAPLFVKYNFNQKNSLVFGANAYYLFNSANIITTYDISYSGIQNKVSKKTTGYFNGFSPYDVGIIAGYRKNIFEKIGVALYLNYGLINIQKSGTTSGNNLHNNISGQLMLTYKLFK